MKGNNAKLIKKIKNNNRLRFKRLFVSTNEKEIRMIKANNTNTECLIKKQYEFVSSLSDAIKDVDTNEKNSPKKNNDKINKKINLSIFFHHL